LTKNPVHLPTKTIDAVLDAYAKQGSLFVFGGGEPFVYDNIDYLEHKLQSLGGMVNYIILSNLKLVDQAIQSSFKRFTVSWNGVTSDSTRYPDCTRNLIKFLDNKGTKQVRIAYVVSPENIQDLLAIDSVMLNRYMKEYNLPAPYFLFEADLSYFQRESATDEEYGMSWLFRLFEKDPALQKHLVEILSALNVPEYTLTAVKDLKQLFHIQCSNPIKSLQISWDNKIRFCPGIKWDNIIFDADEYFSNLHLNQSMLKTALSQCYVCSKLLQCGVGCRYHVDAKNYL